MLTVQDVAKWFLGKESITHKKLQKLCYYGQAWSCALYNGRPLFNAEIQAWVHGPVIPELYVKYVDYKWLPIEQLHDETISLCEEEEDVLNAVYDTYGPLTGDQLERLTHSELPWKEARGDLEPWVTSRTPIDLSTMERFYKDYYEKTQND